MDRLPPGIDESTPLLDNCDEFFDVAVYPLVHEIRVDIVAHIDTPLTYDQLIAPDSTYTIIRPLVEKYLHMRNPSVDDQAENYSEGSHPAPIFCLILNKVQFISDSHKLSIATLSESRATLCEILATRVLRGWSERSLPLATVLLTSWHMFQGAPPEVIESVKDEGEEEVLENSGTALEMAIISSSKRFIRSASCQKVIEGIWSGKIIYSSHSSHALIQDNYKKRPIQIYNPHTAPLLDHYRLKVPKIRALMEYMNFLILFVLYVIAIEQLQTQQITGWEMVFGIYAIAFSVDKLAATREHGLKVFASSLVNGFDLVFVIIFLASFFARVYGTAFHNSDIMAFGSDLLAIGAVLMFPRLVFMTLANNLMILSIRSMLMEFFFLMVVGIICFLGFLYALYTLGDRRYQLNEITWWLLEIYFGLDATGFLTSSQVHPVLGPVLMVIYAFLSNTLLCAVAVAILGNTFAIINADAGAESMFRKAVATIEGVKADSVFSYQLPFNLIALMFLFPLSFVLNPRWFHKVNVMMIRATNLPVLLIIAIYERQAYHNMSVWEQVCDYTDHYMGKLTAAAGFEGFVGARMDVSAVFEVEREYGSYYAGWDDHGPDDENNDNCFEDDDDDDDDAGAETYKTIIQEDHELTESPLEGPSKMPRTVSLPLGRTPTVTSTTELLNSPVAPRKRRSSLSAALNPPSATGSGFNVPPAAPLPGPRVRRNSNLYQPSPLAQLFVRSPDDSHVGLHRRTATVAVGSLPAASSLALLGGSPRRNRMSFPGGLSHGTGVSSSLSTSSIGSIEARGGPRAIKRPSITPIQEDAGGGSLAGSVVDLADKNKQDDKVDSPSRQSGGGSPKKPAVLFPVDTEHRAAPRVAFDNVSTASPSPISPTINLTPATLAPDSSPDRPSPDRPEREKSDKPEKRDKLNRGPTANKGAPSPRLKPNPSGAVPGLKPSQSKAPKTASELLESLEAAGGADQDAIIQLAAIAKIEERQKRIESLLEQLLANQSSGDSGVQVRGAVSCRRRRESEHDTFDDLE